MNTHTHKRTHSTLTYTILDVKSASVLLTLLCLATYTKIGVTSLSLERNCVLTRGPPPVYIFFSTIVSTFVPIQHDPALASINK